MWLPVSGFVLCLPGGLFFTANVRSSRLSEASRSCRAWWWFTCGCDAPVLRASPTGRWDPGLRGGSEDPRAGRRGAAVRTAPPRTSWSGCIGLRTPVPAPAGTRGSIPPRSVGVCAGTQNGDEVLVLFWPEDAESGASGAASPKEDTPCLTRARPLAQVQSLGQAVCACGHTYLSASVRMEVLGVPAGGLCWGSGPPSLGPRLTAPQGGALLPAWGLAGSQAGRQLLCGWRPLPATRVTRRGPGPRRRVSTGS